MRSIPSSLQGFAIKARRRASLRQIDLLGRAAFGLLCIAGMTLFAVPVLLFAGISLPAAELVDGNSQRAFVLWAGFWAAAVACGVLFVALFLAAWPLASDWIIEWPGYAVGFAIAIGSLVGAGVLLLLVPPYVALPLACAASFGAGFAVAGRLAGLKAPSARPRPKAHRPRRR